MLHHMRRDPKAGVTSVDDDGANRRRSGRLPQEGIACDLGRVLDLSSGGMRVVTSRRLKAGSTMQIRLFAHSVQCELEVRVAWVRAIGLVRREIGLIFENVPESVARTIAAIAVTSRDRSTI